MFTVEVVSAVGLHGQEFWAFFGSEAVVDKKSCNIGVFTTTCSLADVTTLISSISNFCIRNGWLIISILPVLRYKKGFLVFITYRTLLLLPKTFESMALKKGAVLWLSF